MQMQSANDFLIYLNVIRKRLWLIILLFLVTEGVILSVTYTAEPVYRAEVRLQVLATDPSDVSLFTQFNATSTLGDIQQAQNDFMRSLKSPFVAWATIADLNLEIGALDMLDGLNTAVEGDFIVVTVESDDPGRAEAIATTQVNNALEYYRNVRATPSRVLREFVTEQLIAERLNMADAEQALLDFKKTNNLDSLDLEARALQDLVRTLQLERDREIIEEARADISAKIYRREQQEALDTAEEIGAMTRAEDGETDTIVGAEEKGPEPQEAAPNTRKFYEDIARQHEATALSYEAKRDGYRKSITLYDSMIEERTADLQEVLASYSEYNALELELARSRNNASFLWEKENEARLRQLQAERLGYIQITEPARKPDAPVSSKTMQLLLVGGAVSILAGFILAFAVEFLGALREAARRQTVR